jgi:hypothetical protein
MNLRTKLLAGYLVFIAALVVLGGWSAWRLREMGDVSQRIISDNYDSVIAAQEMKESLERQDSAALFALPGAREWAVAQMREHRAKFDANFQKAANNITEPGEPDSFRFQGRRPVRPGWDSLSRSRSSKCTAGKSACSQKWGEVRLSHSLCRCPGIYQSKGLKS